MKMAVYIENGTQQMVLTPENKWEKTLLDSFAEKAETLTLKTGQFYHCQGGWVREGSAPTSLMLVIKSTVDET